MQWHEHVYGKYEPGAHGHGYFNLQPFTLTVVKVGTGSGTVTSSPAGINCGGTCSAY